MDDVGYKETATNDGFANSPKLKARNNKLKHGFHQTGTNNHKMAVVSQKSNGFLAKSQNGLSSPQDIESDAVILAKDILHYYGQNKSDLKAPNSHCKTLRRTVDELSERHDKVFNSMVNKLQITRQNCLETFSSVATEIFIDNVVNWGRVVSVYAFAARLGKYCYEHNLSDFVDTLAEFCGQFVAFHTGSWIQQQGGWESMDEYFPDPNALENTLWKGLLFTAVGLGALATMVAAR